MMPTFMGGLLVDGIWAQLLAGYLCDALASSLRHHAVVAGELMQNGLDHRAGHPIFFGLTHSSSRRTEGRRRYLDRFQYGGKHRPGLLPEKPLRGCRPIRACEQEVVDSREALAHA